MFCGRSCSISYQNKHVVKKNQKVSKLEIWIQTRIKETFPSLNVLYNVKDAIGDEGEVDIWAPSIKLAIEINGPSHYLPIFGQEKLENEQKNDKAKADKCKELGIDLLVIDCRNFKTFKKNFELVTIVETVLNKIKSKLNH